MRRAVYRYDAYLWLSGYRCQSEYDFWTARIANCGQMREQYGELYAFPRPSSLRRCLRAPPPCGIEVKAEKSRPQRCGNRLWHPSSMRQVCHRVENGTAEPGHVWHKRRECYLEDGIGRNSMQCDSVGFERLAADAAQIVAKARAVMALLLPLFMEPLAALTAR